MSPKLAHKVIVVIGGTTGLGFSAAKAFVESGAKVVVVGRNPESAAQAEAALGKCAKALVGDAAQPKTAALAISTAVKMFGGFHGLYHVAGGSGRKAGDGPLHEISDAGWEFTLNLNLTSLFYSNHAAVVYFLSDGSKFTTGQVLSVDGGWDVSEGQYPE